MGWYQPPAYNRATHTLTWSIIGKDQGTNDQVVNYTSVVFGRSGIMDSTVVGDYAKAAALAPKLNTVSSMVSFTQGKDYASFRSGDRISDLTMTGLITGVAAAAAYGAAKVGLLAKLGKFLLVAFLALKKAFILVVVAVGAAIKKVWAKLTGRSSESGTA